MAEQRGGHGQAHVPPIALAAHGLRGRFNRENGRANRIQVLAPGRGENAAAALALKHGKAQMGFQARNGAADGALGNVQRFSGLGVTAQTRRLGKGVEFRQRRGLHAHA